MISDNNRQRRLKLFAWIALGSLVLAVAYTYWVIQRNNARAALPGTELPAAGPEELQEFQNQPHLIFLHQEGPHFGQVTLTGLDPDSSQTARTDLRCDRVYYAAGSGICLIYDTSASSQDPLAPIPVWVKLFGPDFQPRHEFTIDGIPSRTRVSQDGRYAAFTVFVAGHSYADPNMSTATILLDTASGESLGNLEDFEVWKDGQVFQAPEFNFWGVTFTEDSNRFYATLRHVKTTYLVEGDIAARTLTVLHENVECPSLSPDGTRIAFKKSVGNRWQLTVLDLATMQETTLAEPEGIDDQVEWLDNEYILYQKADFDPPKWVSVFVVPADGSGKPEVFLPNATSPVVVR